MYFIHTINIKKYPTPKIPSALLKTKEITIIPSSRVKFFKNLTSKKVLFVTIFPSTFFKYLNLKTQDPKKSRQKRIAS
jgi:hypothetical protein